MADGIQVSFDERLRIMSEAAEFAKKAFDEIVKKFEDDKSWTGHLAMYTAHALTYATKASWRVAALEKHNSELEARIAALESHIAFEARLSALENQSR